MPLNQILTIKTSKNISNILIFFIIKIIYIIAAILITLKIKAKSNIFYFF